MGYIKSALIFFLLILMSVVFSIRVLFSWGNTSLIRKFNRSFSRIALFITGVRLKVLNEEGMNARRPAVLVGNHQTGMDFAFQGAMCPTNAVVIVKREILYIPFLGWFLLGAGNILIDRSNPRKARESILSVISIMKEKNLDVAIFPEGTRNRGDKSILLPFKKGAFNLAIEGGFPIIPAVCSSLDGIAIMETGKMNGGGVIISVLPPVETKGLTTSDAQKLAEQVRAVMQAELTRINALVKAGF